jgi:hypothetical protein
MRVITKKIKVHLKLGTQTAKMLEKKLDYWGLQTPHKSMGGIAWIQRELVQSYPTGKL